ncbi:MAG: YncE family protein [Actinomycetota bacterium]
MDLKVRLSLGLAAGCLAAACTPVSSHELEEPSTRRGSSARLALPGAEPLLLSDDGLSTVLDPADGEVGARLRNAVVARDGHTAFGSTIDRGRTTLRTVNLVSGRTLDRTEMDGRFVASVASGSGRLVALTEPKAEGVTPWLPAGRSRTQLVVASPSTGEVRRLRLRGNFEPEAFSTDDRRMFVIEYMPALAPSHYSVRRLNLETGRVRDIARLKQLAPRVMRGTGRMQVLDPAGDLLYTLYTQQGPGYSHGEAPGDRTTPRAFVHVLNLEEGWAHCIDLPHPFGSERATASALAISPDGSRLYVSEWTNGAIAVIDPRSLKVLRTVSRVLGSVDDRTFAEVGSDGSLYLAGNSEVVSLDGSTLDVLERWTMDRFVSGLAVSADASRVHVAIPRRLMTLDAATGEWIGRAAIQGAPTVRALTSL